MRGRSILFLFLVCGCERVEKHPFALSDDEIEEMIAARPGLSAECRRTLRETGWIDRFDDCFAMLPAQRWSGTWVTGWEWSNFCAAPARDCDVSFRKDEWELDFRAGAAPSEMNDGTYAIEFIGRRTAEPGHFGHLDQYPHRIIVDRVLSLRKISNPEPK